MHFKPNTDKQMTYMAIQSKGFTPTFENGGFWEYYKDLERQFEDFLVYVPYLEGNEGTYSYRLANLILSIGAHIDSAFKEIARYSPFATKYPLILKNTDGTPKKPTIWDYYPLAEELNLSKQKVTFKRLPIRDELFPFAQYQKAKDATGKDCVACPNWWNAYNGIKHKFSENFIEAKIITIRDALAGAFLLNVIHEPASLRLSDYGLVKPKYLPVVMWEEKYDTFKGRKQHKERPSFEIIEDAFIIETPLFSYDYEEAKNLKSP
jgi:hypothetical protein